MSKMSIKRSIRKIKLIKEIRKGKVIFTNGSLVRKNMSTEEFIDIAMYGKPIAFVKKIKRKIH